MKNVRLVLAGLAAAMILLGDCTQSEARCRLFGRRARGNCAPRAACAATATSVGVSMLADVICPVQQTPYYAGKTNGVDYYMFYAYTFPQCSGMPQPVYLPAGSPVGCTGDEPPCFNPAKEIADRPPNLSDLGHRLTEGQLKGFGEPVGRYLIDIGTGGSHDERNIDFYQLDVPTTGPGRPRPPEEVWIGIENPYGSYGPPLVPYSSGGWYGHRYGRTVALQKGGRPYYVLLVDPTATP